MVDGTDVGGPTGQARGLAGLGLAAAEIADGET